MKLTKRNGHYLVSNPNLSQANEMLLDSGDSLEVSMKLVDKRHMSDEQRRFIFKLCSIVEFETGLDKELFRGNMMTVYNNLYNDDLKSLTQYSMSDANKLIDLIITMMIDKEIPIEINVLKDNSFKFNANHTYLMCFKRTCVVCGRRADLHHVDSVGMGYNRNKISHVGKRMLPLCRAHHNQAHDKGNNWFIDYYHLEPTVIDEKLEYFIKTGKIKVMEEN